MSPGNELDSISLSNFSLFSTSGGEVPIN